MRKLALYLFCLLVLFVAVEAKVPDISEHDVKVKLEEIMKVHASHKKITPSLVKRAISNYLEELDPLKTYFIEPDIKEYIDLNERLVARVLDEYENHKFSVFAEIYHKMCHAILRRREIDQWIGTQNLPEKVNPEEFRKIEWAKSEQDLMTRLMRIKSLQIDVARKLDDDSEGRILERIAKRQERYEEDMLTSDREKANHLMLAKILKAYASALDTHTAYFTPDEAAQFLINVQQRLFGLGVQLRDDISGFTVVHIVEGSPAARNKNIKVKDRIVAIDGEPVVGLDIIDIVEMIRGPENTTVTLTVIRDSEEGEERLVIPVERGEVVIQDSRFESSYEPYGDGVIAYLRLHTFYQDGESSSAKDLGNEMRKLKADHKVLGIILDLRSNTGGMLTQAVAVTGLFITKGVVVSVKDYDGSVQHLRDIDGQTAWDGPLIVLINRASASASEIVAQTLQDYGRALIIGDDRSYGKGSFQIFTLSSSGTTTVNPKGEYKVTRGRYYTVSGKSPQLVGVSSDIVIPGSLSESEIGEQFAKYPLETDMIKPNFDDDLSDIPYFQRKKIEKLYKFNLQKKLDIYSPYLESLGRNTAKRLENNLTYQSFLKEIKKKDKEIEDNETDKYGNADLQLIESLNVMKDLILLMNLHEEGQTQEAIAG